MLLSAAAVDVTGDQPTSRIVNGDETSDYEAVGIVNNGCTGTLISSTHVLTAAHCTEGVGDRAGTFEVGGRTYRTSDIVDHPQYNPNRFEVGYDLSVMELDRPVQGIEPMEIYRSTPQVGQMLTLVGFGEGGTSRNGSLGDFGTKRVGETPIDKVSNLHVSWDFDSHEESNTAPGDSGGPAFVTVNDNLFIAGVTSGGEGDSHRLGDHSFDTRIDVFQEWIDGIVGDSGGDDGGGDDGGGDDGGGGDGRHEFSNDQRYRIRSDAVNTISSKIDVDGLPGRITDLNVSLDIDHTWTEDLHVQVIAPNGRRITLFNRVGGDGDDFDNTVLDGQATESIRQAEAPFRGVFRPTGNLGRFDGMDGNGTWTLRVRDNFAEDGGFLNKWTLSFETDDQGDDGDGQGDRKSFANETPKDIPSDRRAGVVSRTNVTGMSGKLTDVLVKLNIDHTRVGDLQLFLRSPAGTKIPLVRNVGADGQDFTNTVFDDSATVSINDGDAPFTGSFRPDRDLASFSGESANGNWRLIIRDRVAGNGGRLQNWTLTVETDGSRKRTDGPTHARASESHIFRNKTRRRVARAQLSRMRRQQQRHRRAERAELRSNLRRQAVSMTASQAAILDRAFINGLPEVAATL